jgi:hypothetical protein
MPETAMGTGTNRLLWYLSESITPFEWYGNGYDYGYSTAWGNGHIYKLNERSLGRGYARLNGQFEGAGFYSDGLRGDGNDYWRGDGRAYGYK